jgi:phosphate transport system substrate-binding protein
LNHRALILGLLLACSISGCAGPSAEPDHEIYIGADSASAPLAEGLLNAFEAGYPDVVFSISQDSRASVLDALQNNQIDAALLLFPLENSSLFTTPIAEEPILLVVDPANPVTEITLSDARALYAGRIANWQSLGGPDLPVTLLTYLDDNSTRLVLESLLLDGLPMSPAARTVTDEQSVIQLVSTTAGSIGYLPYSSLNKSVTPLTIDNAPPTLDAARRRTYPLVAQVIFVSKSEPDGFTRDFLDWLLSAPGQQVVHRYMLGYSD